MSENLCDVIVPGNLDVTTPEITQLSASTMNAKQTRVTGLAEMLVHETFSVQDLSPKNSRSSGTNKPPRLITEYSIYTNNTSCDIKNINFRSESQT